MSWPPRYNTHFGVKIKGMVKVCNQSFYSENLLLLHSISGFQKGIIYIGTSRSWHTFQSTLKQNIHVKSNNCLDFTAVITYKKCGNLDQIATHLICNACDKRGIMQFQNKMFDEVSKTSFFYLLHNNACPSIFLSKVGSALNSARQIFCENLENSSPKQHIFYEQFTHLFFFAMCVTALHSTKVTYYSAGL